MKRLVRIMMTLSILLAAFPFAGATQALAEDSETNVDFILHKLAIPSSEMPDNIQNDGTDTGEAADLLKDYEGLNGVTFAVYDVTAAFYQKREELRADNLQGEALQEAAQQALVDGALENPKETKTTETIDGEAGQVRFSLPAKSAEKDAVYLFRETGSPENVEAPAEDLVVVLPIYLNDDQSLATMDTIHLYPKNAIVEDPPTFDKTIVDQQPSYQYGDSIDYQLTTKVPISLSKYTKYTISDQADTSLVMEPESLKVTADQTTLVSGTDYQQSIEEHGFTLELNLDSLKELTGKTITITYSMRLNSYEKIDQALINHATLTTDFDELKDQAEIYTGGKKFLKVDLADQNQHLSGAVFVIQNEQDEYLQKTATGYQWTKNIDQAYTLESNQQGEFQVMGMRYGNYFLKELEAPAGYVVSQEAVPFMITKGGATVALKVVNKATTKQVIPPAPQTPSTPQASSSKLFPKTNMLTNYWLIIAGGLILVVVILLRKKNKE